MENMWQKKDKIETVTKNLSEWKEYNLHKKQEINIFCLYRKIDPKFLSILLL